MTEKPLYGDDFDEDALYDGRQSETATRIMRGVSRMLATQSFASLPEVSLPNHRRADLLAVGSRGEIWIIEIKSSLTDFQTDKKWPDYLDYCDSFFFAVEPDFPVDRLPADTGRVYFGAFVTLEDEDGDELAIRIVGHDETDTAKRWISVDAPLARALLGKALDDEATVAAPGGETRYIITAIDYRDPGASR